MLRRHKVLIGIDYTRHAIRVASSLGHRSTISGNFPSPEDWLDHVFYGVSLPAKAQVCGVIAMPVDRLRAERRQVQEAARERHFERVNVCSCCYAAAHATGRSGEMLVVHITPELSSISLIGKNPPRAEDEDFVRPIAGREAREILVSLRCLIKAVKDERRRRLLDQVIITGLEQEVDRIGRSRLDEELWSLGIVPQYLLDAHLVADGALEVAQKLRS